MHHLLPPQFGQAIGWTILHSLWQAMLIAILSATVMVLLRQKKAAIRYRVAGLSLGLILLSAVATFCWYAQQPEPVASGMDVSVKTEMWASPSPGGDSVSAAEQQPKAAQNMGPLATVQAYFEPHISLIAVLWCLGFALCLLRLLGDIGQVYYLKTQRNFSADEYWIDLKDGLLRKAGLNKVVALVESTLVRTPLVVGHLKPFIMFPIGLINRLDPFEAEAIIAHEIAHIVRRDYLFNILQSLVETIFYYHPAVWWLSSTMRREREIAADELAIVLTGNPVNYAKALVVVQELAYFPLSPALAFAGQRKSQLFTRIQRILHSKHSKSLVMEKFISASAFVLLLVGLTFAQINTAPQNREDSTEMTNSQFAPPDSTSGIWEGKIENGELCLTMTQRSKRNNWNTHDCYPLSDFSALPNGKGAFTMTREAGTITFSGDFDGKEGFGRFQFQENADFRKMLSERGIKNVEDGLMIHFCVSNVTRSYLDFLNQKGYKNVDADELAGLAVHGLDEATITSYLDIFAKAGKKDVELDDLMSFKVHDVSGEYIALMNSLGFKNLSLDDVLAAKIHGITPEFVQSCKALGYTNLDFDEVLSAKIHGITPEFVQSCKAMGYTNLGFDDVLSFKIHGMSPEYLTSLKNAGLTDLSADEAMGFKIHNITPEYIASLKAAGFTNLDADDIQGFKVHNVTPEYVASLKSAGLANLDTEDILAFKVHDVTPELIAAYRSLGFKNMSNDDLMGLKIHGVDAAFIESYKSVFDKTLDIDEVMSLKIHDVTPDFIRRAREKGFKDMSVDEYIQLKVQFGNKIK